MADDYFNKENTNFWAKCLGFIWTVVKGLPMAINTYLKFKQSRAENALAKKLGEKEMSEKKDIKNVMEILDFGFSALSFEKELLKDGKFHFESLGLIMPLYPKALAAYEDAGQAIPELADLDESEAAQLVAFVIGKGIANEHAAAIISKSLKVGVSIISLIKEINAPMSA